MKVYYLYFKKMLRVFQHLFILFCLLAASLSNAQNVTIDDANFKAYLVGNPSINTNADSEIQVSEATSFTGSIVCNNLGINSLSGIEAFVNVEVTNASSNNLSSIDLSANTQLLELGLFGNQLTSLDLSNNTLLQELTCANNSISSLNLSQNINLVKLDASGNMITSIDLSQNILLEELSLTSMDLASIDVTPLTALTELYVYSTQIQSIDISQNTDLAYLDIEYNQLAEIDISENTLLEEAILNGNTPLYHLNAANGNNEILYLEVDTSPNLSCIQVSNVAYADANWTKDAAASFSLDCPDPFITTWKTDNPGTSNDDEITIPVLASGSTGYTVDWGDGSVTNETLNGITHTYSSPGTYTIKILGDLQALSFDNGGDKEKLLSIEQWGDIAWTRMDRAYRGCSNLVINATDAPDLSIVTTMQMMFFGASSFNQPIDHWDVSEVTNMGFLFTAATSFNQPLNGWDVSKVSNMSSMFSSASVFDKPLDNWITTSLTNTSFMFSQADAFNQPLNDWDMSKVTTMESMFNRNDAFNQPLDEWDVSKVENLTRMFTLASKFDQSLGDWDISMVTQMFDILDNSNLSIENYDQTLIGWSELTVQNDIRLEAFGVNYCNGYDARNKLISDFNWLIIDGIQECPAGVDITWNGSSWSNGTGSSNDGSNDVVLDGDYDYEAQGELHVNDLTINVDATLTVNTEEPLKVVNDLVNNGSLILESGATLLTYESGSISGNPVLIKRNTRYADGRYSFVGSPVQQDASITGNDLGSFVFRYNETTPYGANDGLSRWEDASADELVPGKGYTQADLKEITFSGIPSTGEIAYNGSYTEDTDDANEGWNLVANPYTAAINVSNFLSENTNTSGAVYLWDDNGSNIQRGSNADYIVANASMATSTAAGGQSRYNFHLGSAQGFFVQLNGAIETDIVFTEDMRVEGSNADDNFFRSTPIPIVRINLSNTIGLFKQAVIGFGSDASLNELNPIYDAKAFNAKAEHGIFTLKAGRSLALNGVPNEWEVIQLQVNIAENGNYTIELENEGYEGDLFLKDNETGEIVDLRNASYSFFSIEGIHTNRFELKSSNAQILGLEDRSSLVYIHDDILYLNNTNKEMKNYQLFNLHGQLLLSQEVYSKTEMDVGHLESGVYLVYDGDKTHKILLK